MVRETTHPAHPNNPSMGPGTIALLVAVFLLVDGLVVGTVVAMARRSWNGLAAAFPPREPLPNAVGRNFQSFRLDLFNLGWSVHVVADEDCLHLRPASFVRFAFGLRPASIPWEAVRLLPNQRPRRYLRARVGSADMLGPAWCLRLAAAPELSPTTPTTPPT